MADYGQTHFPISGVRRGVVDKIELFKGRKSMKWQGRRKSDNVVDRRRVRAGGIAVGGGLGGVIVLVLYLLLGGDPSDIQQNLQIEGPTSSTEVGEPLSAHQEEMGEFVAVVLADIEDVWGELFRQMGLEYREPRLVL
jgi:predicted metalloprotease